jgi:hypothetical protein
VVEWNDTGAHLFKGCWLTRAVSGLLAGATGYAGDAAADVEVAPAVGGVVGEGAAMELLMPRPEPGHSLHLLLRAAATSDILNRHVLRTCPVRGYAGISPRRAIAATTLGWQLRNFATTSAATNGSNISLVNGFSPCQCQSAMPAR